MQKVAQRPTKTNEPFPLYLQMINDGVQAQFIAYFFAGDGSDASVRANLHGPFVGRCTVRNLGRTSLYDIYFAETVHFGPQLSQPIQSAPAMVAIDSLTSAEEFHFVTTNWSKNAAWIVPANVASAKSTLSGVESRVPLRVAAGTTQFLLGPDLSQLSAR